MCLHKIKYSGIDYKTCWKVFNKKDDGLHSITFYNEISYSEDKEYLSDDYGFCAFTNKKDAETFRKTLLDNDVCIERWDLKDLVIKKVKCDEIIKWGEQIVGYNFHYITKPSIAFKKMTIISELKGR